MGAVKAVPRFCTFETEVWTIQAAPAQWCPAGKSALAGDWPQRPPYNGRAQATALARLSSGHLARRGFLPIMLICRGDSLAARPDQRTGRGTSARLRGDLELGAHGVTSKLLDPTAVSEVVALRFVAARPEPLTVRQLARDVAALVKGAVPKAAVDAAVDEAVAGLAAADRLVRGDGGRLAEGPAAPPVKRLADCLGSGRDARKAWSRLKTVVLPARAVGLGPREVVAEAETLATASGLRARVLVAAFGLPDAAASDAAALRNALTSRALQAAYGVRIVKRLGRDPRYPPQIARAIAAELAREPRDHPTDSSLFQALAAECAGIRRPDMASLRAALVRRFLLGQPLEPPRPAEQPEATPKSAGAPRSQSGETQATPRLIGHGHGADLEPATDPAAEEAASVALLPPRSADGPPVEIGVFSAAVNAVTRDVAEGWAGARKAYINRVWAALAERRPDWNLTEAAFKALLVRAHREGRVVLVYAELRRAETIADIQASATRYQNAEWHFIRVAD